jgi:hypothetical protein
VLAAFMLASVMMKGGHFLASPYYSGPRQLTDEFAVALTLDAADARLAPPDDVPQTAAQVPALREALAAAAATRFDLAAAALVAHAVAHPYAPESGWALRRAYIYWRALGRDTDADLTRERYETHHAARERRAAAEFFWSRRLELPDGPPRRAHLRAYLERHAHHGPPDLQLVAEAELAADLWRSACERPWHGLCVTFVWTSRKGACNPGPVPLFTVHPRDQALSREALRHAASVARHARALDLARVAPWRRPALRAALGEAALVAADDALEALIALEFPRKLSFFVEDYKHRSGNEKWERDYREQVRHRDDSVTRFTRYWHTYNLRMAAAVRQIEAAGATHSGPAILTAMARLAVAYGEVWDEQEFASELPAEFGDDDAPWCCEPAYSPLPELASDFFSNCAALARRSHQSGPEVALCFEGFGRIHGDEHALSEFPGRG